MNKQEQTFLVKFVIEVAEFIGAIDSALEDRRINIFEVFRIGKEGKDVFEMFKDFSGFNLETITSAELLQVAATLKGQIEADKITERIIYLSLEWIKSTALLGIELKK